jgi:hypothetical protein
MIAAHSHFMAGRIPPPETLRPPPPGNFGYQVGSGKRPSTTLLKLLMGL